MKISVAVLGLGKYGRSLSENLYRMGADVLALSSVLNDLVDMISIRAGRKGLKLVTDFDRNMPRYLHGDEIRLKQVIMNLLTNAVKYTENGQVTFSVGYSRTNNKKESIVLRVAVKDTGIGIKEEDMDKLFSSFQRLDETKNRNIEGTGLGLNITKQLVEMMGGRINVESEYGKGSTFIIEIEQEVISSVPIGDYTQKLEKAQVSMDRFNPVLIAPKAKILIVDDNEMNLEVITGLIKDTKVNVTTALSGKECIDKLRKAAFDIVLLDQMMPGMSGTQTLSIIKEQHLADDTPINSPG